jgi:peroxiredoxin
MSAKTRKRPSHHHMNIAARPAHRSPAPRSVVHRAEASEVSNAANRAHPRPQQRRGAQQTKARPGRYAQVERQRQNRLLLKVGGAVLGGILALGVIYMLSNSGSLATGTGQQKQYRFDVASPATGALAPDFSLLSTTGGAVRLSDLRGKNVLLYFQEGIGCEGCWTQLKDIESEIGRFQQLGIKDVVTITTNPLGALKQKVADEQIAMPVLSDESFAVSHAYNATMYGMMAGSADGHTFILVGPDGRIRWRADYGGPPDYTMYVPINSLIADIKAGANAK